jgi:hypothetical protein
MRRIAALGVAFVLAAGCGGGDDIAEQLAEQERASSTTTSMSTTTQPETPTSTSATTESAPPIVEITPVSVDCSSEVPPFPCSALTDDDPSNSWNAEGGGVGVEIVFLFSPPVAIAEMVLANLVDEEGFRRNARVQGYEITLDDLPQVIVGDLDDISEPQRITVGSLRTTRLVLTITTAFPGETYDGEGPFRELALQQVWFFGRPVPNSGG